MAHNLDFAADGKARLALVKEPAWHGLGQIFDREMTQEEVIREARLDYRIELDDVMCRGKKVLGYKGILNADTNMTLGIMRGRYTPIQNVDGFRFFDAFIDKAEAIYHSAGAIQGGKIAWILAKLPSYITVGDDVVDMYVIVILNHGGNKSVMIGFTPVRVVCNNTLNAAIEKLSRALRIAHNKNFVDEFDRAHEILEIRNAYETELKETFEAMMATRVNNDQAADFFAKVVTLNPTSDITRDLSQKALNRLGDMMDYYAYHDTQQAITGTAYGLYNAVTGYFQNVKEWRSQDQKFNNILVSSTGDAQRYGNFAFAAAQSLVS